MENKLKTAEFIANLLDNKFVFFGRSFGWNGILGLIPGIGDIIPTVLSLYLVWLGLQMGLPGGKIIQMVWNVVINFGIGLIPVAGDYVDFFHKANLKNLRILKEYLKEHQIIEGEVV